MVNFIRCLPYEQFINLTFSDLIFKHQKFYLLSLKDIVIMTDKMNALELYEYNMSCEMFKMAPLAPFIWHQIEWNFVLFISFHFPCCLLSNVVFQRNQRMCHFAKKCANDYYSILHMIIFLSFHFRLKGSRFLSQRMRLGLILLIIKQTLLIQSDMKFSEENMSIDWQT